MSTHCEQEFMLKNFWFHHKRPIIFVTPQVGPHVLYPAWSAIQLFYHIIALIVDGYQAGQRDGEPTGNYFLYLPNWTYMLLVLSNVVDLFVTMYVHRLARYILQEREHEKAEAEVIMRNRVVKISYKTMGSYYTMRGYLKVTWALFTLSSVTGVTVTILYWTLHILNVVLSVDYNLNGPRLGENTLDYGSLAFNFFNTLVILVHLAITAKPFRLLHFYMPVSFFAVYIIFTVIYQMISDHYIYKVLDWDEALVTPGIAYGVVFIVVPLVHLLVYGLVQLRIRVGTWCMLRYSFSKWKKSKIVPAEPEIDPDTNVMRWLSSNRMKKAPSADTGDDSDMAGGAASRAETISIKSGTSL